MRQTIAAIAALMFVSCSAQPGPVRLTDEWPAKTRSYDDVTRNWTRSGKIVSNFDKLLEIHATFKSPEWRAAYVEWKAKRDKLPASERASLVEAQKKAASEFHEIELLVTTYDSRDNDLQKGDKSIWSLALFDSQGNRVQATSVKRDRRPASVIRDHFPKLGEFAEAYVVRFPRDADVLRSNAKQFSLRMSSSRGVVELIWNAVP